MDLFQIFAILLVLTAGVAWLNHRYLGLPTTIGLMVITLALSLLFIFVGPLDHRLEEEAARVLESIDFDRTLLHGVLGFLLFAGALHVDLSDLRRHGLVVGILATIGTALSTVIVGGVAWVVLLGLGIPIPLLHALLFGVLISPTDPIAVLAMLKSVGVPRRLEVQIAGESLFNDGVGVVLFLGLLEMVRVEPRSGEIGLHIIARLFAQEAIGGILFGLVAGAAAYHMLKSIDGYQIEILISLALVTGGYALADALHLSAPLAMVVAGLLIGNQGRAFAMSDRTREHLDTFWELVDEILNAVLFVLLGLEVFVLTFQGAYVVAGLVVIPVVLGARFLAVGIPVRLLARSREFAPHTVKILTWAGLRGGISVALALSLRSWLPAATTDVLLVMTYMVVVFSVVVQGLTIERVLRRYAVTSPPEPAGGRPGGQG